jgi:CRP-like cAMP-binding protein
MGLTEMRIPRRSWLPELELFAGCSPRQCRELQSVCTPLDVAAGHILCRQGAVAEQCFIVVSGRANVFMDGALVAEVHDGELIGELALLGGPRRRNATVIAASDMRVLALSRREFASLKAASMTVQQRVLGAAIQRLIDNAQRGTTALSPPR